MKKVYIKYGTADKLNLRLIHKNKTIVIDIAHNIT